MQEGRQYVPSAFSFSSDDEPENGVADALSALEGKGTTSNRSSYSVKSVHQRTSSSVDPASLAEFAATLPSHLKGFGTAALVNNDDAHDRRRFTTAFAAGHRTSTVTSSANKRLSSMNAPKESDRKDWRMCKCLFCIVLVVSRILCMTQRHLLTFIFTFYSYSHVDRWQP